MRASRERTRSTYSHFALRSRKKRPSNPSQTAGVAVATLPDRVVNSVRGRHGHGLDRCRHSQQLLRDCVVSVDPPRASTSKKCDQPQGRPRRARISHSTYSFSRSVYMSQQPVSPPPIPQSPDPAVGSSVRRSHTISASSRRTGSRAADHSEADEWNEHDTVGEDWVGDVGTIGEKNASLHRQASLPSKYNRSTYSGSSTAPKSINCVLLLFEDSAHVFLAWIQRFDLMAIVLEL